MVFGKFVSFVFGGAVGAYGMHHYIDTLARKGQVPDWSKISSDLKFVCDSTTTTFKNIANH